jgi:IMP cyclohydrolase
VAYRDDRAVQWWLYFLTGRSAASRERRLRYSVDRLVVEATGPALADDLRHYSCTRSSASGVVVGNGDHVDVLAAAQEVNRVIEEIDPEPDAPIFTPRIAVVMSDGGAATEVVAVRRVGHQIVRQVQQVTLGAGQGLRLHTYGGTTQDIEIDAVPRSFEAEVDVDQLAATIWSGLVPTLRVALAYGRASTPEPAVILS